MGDSGCGFAVRDCRRRSLRRRRSGGPELFASVTRRGNTFPSAQLPPLPQTACTHAKLKVNYFFAYYFRALMFLDSSALITHFQSI